ncbi:MAG TPA: lipocalin family protein [Caulobacteraceae bacterium]|jgi:apolipoprotein D and lipocalin family protein|nr:lipocalin family protein [Caulobacteraceae bacterium]
MKFVSAAAAFAALLTLSAPALAMPQPAKPVAANLYSGRWYEIARTTNKMQAGCVASTTDFSGWRGGAFSAVQTCHKGAPTGPKQTISVQGHVLPSSGNAKMQLGMLGGLISREYWILDHADDNNWLIMTTSDGRYVWLMSRQPVVPQAVKAAAIGRMQQLGLNLTKLAFQ